MLDRAALASLGVDDALIETRRRLDGEDALAFLARLPDLVRSRERELGLAGSRIMAGGALSAVLACTRVVDRRPVVLKLSVAGAAAEAAALTTWAGSGACALLAASEDETALVLDAIRPGRAVAPSGDESADALAAARLLALLRRPPAGLPGAIPDGAAALRWRFGRAARWIAEGRAAAGVSRDEFDDAAAAAAELHATATPMLCHGDFLGKNILIDGAGRWPDHAARLPAARRAPPAGHGGSPLGFRWLAAQPSPAGAARSHSGRLHEHARHGHRRRLLRRSAVPVGFCLIRMSTRSFSGWPE